jgi:predicted aconitase with swiveling domain
VILKGRGLVGGLAEGEALVSRDPISFYGGVNPDSGYITEPGHVCFGDCLKGKIFVFPHGKGSTVGSYVLYRMKKLGTSPAAIINRRTDAIIATGCVMSNIPLVDHLEDDPLEVMENGNRVKVNSYEGIVEILNI